LSREAVPSFAFPLPPGQLVNRFDLLARATLERLQALEQQSNTLDSLRDALLAKLISGELRVADAGRIVGLTQ
jgi:type I restriction enzyme S subunit